LAKSNDKKRTTEAPALNMDGLVNSLGYSLRRAQIYAFQEFNRSMDAYQIRPTQYGLLVLLDANPGLKQTVVSHALGIQKANFVGLLDGLEKRGLAERRKEGTDRRSYALHLTPQGKTLVRKLKKEHQQYEDRIVKRLGAEESRMLLEMLHRLHHD
jgi:DNA-binding MarR family transcriptional regulator